MIGMDVRSGSPLLIAIVHFLFSFSFVCRRRAGRLRGLRWLWRPRGIVSIDIAFQRGVDMDLVLGMLHLVGSLPFI